jgi:hypothetical protein
MDQRPTATLPLSEDDDGRLSLRSGVTPNSTRTTNGWWFALVALYIRAEVVAAG